MRPHPAPWFGLVLLGAVTVLTLPPVASAQSPSPSPNPTLPVAVLPSNNIPATVTKEMGDRGGKFFGQPPDPKKTRRFYIAIEPDLWDYAPLGQDPMCGLPFPPPLKIQRRGGKIRYVQYTDETFTSKVFSPQRLGIMGPTLRGVVGEFLAITVLNRSPQPFSAHPHGVKYDKDSEGSYYLPKPGLGAAIGPDARFTYVWHLDEGSGPLPSEPSSKGWLYHSHVTGDGEAGLGLVGFIIVTDPNRARADGTPSDVDREEAALFMIFDESGLGAAEKEAAEYGLPGKSWTQVQEMTAAGVRAAINGYIFGNLPGLDINEGERVRWYLFGLGSEEDFHTAHWHGLRVIEDGRRRTDNIELLPATMKVADMVADNPGSWLFHCHVADHMNEGMFARVTVHPKERPGAGLRPEDRYFGLVNAQKSLAIKRAEAALDLQPGAAAPCKLQLAGTVTVFDAFSVFTQPVTVRIGGTSFECKPDRTGLGRVAGNSWQITNGGRFGVVYGGLMEFETTLSGANWLAELQKLGLNPNAAPGAKLSVPITIQIGTARHTATAEFTIRRK